MAVDVEVLRRSRRAERRQAENRTRLIDAVGAAIEDCDDDVDVVVIVLSSRCWGSADGMAGGGRRWWRKFAKVSAEVVCMIEKAICKVPPKLVVAKVGFRKLWLCSCTWLDQLGLFVIAMRCC